jgi:acyl-CoA hydrolase
MPVTGKTPRASFTEMTELVLPQHGNVLGTAFGGTRVAVTAALDEVDFLAPIRVGDIVVLSAQVNAAFGSSLEVEVEVKVEDRLTGARTLCVDSFMTFVSIGDDGKPCKVPSLLHETADDERRVEQATQRRAARLARRGR